jgi:hypothetical protein
MGEGNEKKCATNLSTWNLDPHENAHLRIIYVFLPPKLTIFLNYSILIIKFN